MIVVDSSVLIANLREEMTAAVGALQNIARRTRPC